MAHPRASVRPAPAAFTLPAAAAILLLAGWAGLLAWQTWTRIGLTSAAYGNLSLARFLPLNPGLFASHWLTAAKNWLLLAAWILAAHGWGRLLLEKICPAERSRLDEALYALGLGLAGFSLLIFLLGIGGFYRTAVFPVLFGGLAASGAWLTWRRRVRLRPARGWFLGRPAASDRALALLAGGILLLALISANAPNIFFDAMVYHLAVPSQWILAGGIRPWPYNFFSNLPMNVEMLYTGALLLSSESLCRLLHVLLGVMAFLGVFSLGRRWFGRRAGLWAAVLFISVPVVILNGLQAGVDVGAAAFAVLGVLALLAWVLGREGGERQPFLAGLLIGAALAGKYNTAFLLAPAVPAALWAGRAAGREWKNLLSAAAKIAAGALLLLLPWLVKSAVFTGNPVYPFFYKYLPGRYLQADKMQQQMDGFREYGQRTWQQFLRQPWDLTFYFPTDNSCVGTVFLFLLPGLLLLAPGWRRAPPALRVLLVTLPPAALIWSSQTQIARYFIPVLPLLAAAGAATLEQWERRSPALARLGRWCAVGFVYWAAATALVIILLNWDPLGAGLGLEPRSVYLDRTLMNSYAPVARVVNQLPSGTKLLIVGETRAYYFERPATAATVYDRNPFIELLDRAPSAEEAWKRLRQEGYTHLFISYMEAARTRGYEPYRWTPEALASLQELRGRYLTPIFTYGEEVLYALADRPLLDRPVKRGRPLFTYDRELMPKILDHFRGLTVAMTRRQYADAVAEAQRMTQLAPDWDLPYRQLGLLHLQLGQLDESFQAYRRADELAGLDAGSYNNLGMGYLNRREFNEARACFQAALRQEPDLAVARQNLDRILQFQAGQK